MNDDLAIVARELKRFRQKIKGMSVKKRRKAEHLLLSRMTGKYREELEKLYSLLGHDVTVRIEVEYNGERF